MSDDVDFEALAAGYEHRPPSAESLRRAAIAAERAGPPTEHRYYPEFGMVRDGDGGGWFGSISPMVTITVVRDY